MARAFNHARFSAALADARQGDLMPLAALVRTLVTAYARADGDDDIRQTAWADSMEAIASLLDREPMLSRVAAQIRTITFRKVTRAKTREGKVYKLITATTGDDQTAIDLDLRAVTAAIRPNSSPKRNKSPLRIVFSSG